METPGVSKYAIEHYLDLHGLWDPNNYIFTPQQLEFSILEVIYCDFLYADPADYRFLRKTAFYSLTGTMQSALTYEVVYDPNGNDGNCGGSELDPTVIETNLPVNAQTFDMFWVDLDAIMVDLGI